MIKDEPEKRERERRRHSRSRSRSGSIITIPETKVVNDEQGELNSKAEEDNSKLERRKSKIYIFVSIMYNHIHHKIYQDELNQKHSWIFLCR